MEQVRLEQLESAGIDVKDALSRFMGNANLLEKFLKKFPDDQNYKKLCEALEADDAEAALAASHIKGSMRKSFDDRAFGASYRAGQGVQGGGVFLGKRIDAEDNRRL